MKENAKFLTKLIAQASHGIINTKIHAKALKEKNIFDTNIINANMKANRIGKRNIIKGNMLHLKIKMIKKIVWLILMLLNEKFLK